MSIKLVDTKFQCVVNSCFWYVAQCLLVLLSPLRHLARCTLLALPCTRHFWCQKWDSNHRDPAIRTPPKEIQWKKTENSITKSTRRLLQNWDDIPVLKRSSGLPQVCNHLVPRSVASVEPPSLRIVESVEAGTRPSSSTAECGAPPHTCRFDCRTRRMGAML